MLNSLMSGLIGAIIGAIIGGFVSALGSYFFTKKHTEKLEKKKIKNFTKAIYLELTSLKEKYMEIVGDLIEKIDIDKEMPIIGILQTNQNYFAVFDNLSSDLLGLLDKKIAKNVIDAYINTKALFDELVAFGNQWKSFYDLLMNSVLINYSDFNKCINSYKLPKNKKVAIDIEKLENLLKLKMKNYNYLQYFKNYDPCSLLQDITEVSKYLEERHKNVIHIINKAIDDLI